MFRLPHHEEMHITGGRAIAEAVLGTSDGLTVPFALAAGLSGVVANPGLIFLVGSAEMVAGGVSMGLGGYLATKSYNDVYARELAREVREVRDTPEQEREEVRHILRKQGFEGPDLERAVQVVTSDRERWLRFMMREEMGMREEDLRPPGRSAVVVGGSYMVGALVPLLPYLFVARAVEGLLYSAFFTLLALFAAGVLKGRASGRPWLLAGAETLLIGAIAAGTAYAIARLLAAGGVGA